jgi:hypothetical protein
MVENAPKIKDVEQRRDAALARALATPHKPHKPLKAVKKQGKRKLPK